MRWRPRLLDRPNPKRPPGRRVQTGAGVLATGVAALALMAGCGGGADDGSGTSSAPTSRVEVTQSAGRSDRLDAERIYAEEAAGVVTIKAIFDSGGNPLEGGGGQEGLGSGFVISGSGEIATNAHVVTNGDAGNLTKAREVYVQFEDANEVPARIVGADPNADVALLKIDPKGLRLRALSLASGRRPQVGEPVAAIGSPFGEPQSLSVGVVSGLDRSIASLTNFQIPGAVQTDAAINRGNSGGPLVDAAGKVIGINSQIRSTSGGGEGVGFAVPAAMVRRSLDQLRTKGRVSYPYLGISTAMVYPQLAQRFKLGVDHGAWIQDVRPDGPAGNAGLRGGDQQESFQAANYRVGGDVIAAVGGTPIRRESDLPVTLNRYNPGDKVALEIWRAGQRTTVTVKLGERPSRDSGGPLTP